MGTVKGRVALITGAANDEGEAISLRLAKKQAKVVVADSNSTKVEALVKKMSDEGFQVEGLVVDTAKPSEVKETVDGVTAKYGAIDILVNCTDYANSKAVSEISAEDWDISLKMNLNPVVLFCQYSIPKMREKKHGRIINLGSLAYLGSPGKANYSAAKSAIFGLTRSLALELAKEGVTVNSLVKGDIMDTASEMSEDEQAKAAKGIPVQRLGNPDDLAYASYYFASDESKYVTGQTLFVCGGKSLYSSMSV